MKDLSGMKFNRLTVLGRTIKDNKHVYWMCKCDCGQEKIVRSDSLLNGAIQSCGCLNRENAKKLGKTNRKHNSYVILDDCTQMKDAKGNICLIDTEDIEKISGCYWSLTANGYFHNITDGQHKTLHRFLLGFPDGMDIDHINGNRQDNRKSNLRVCTHVQNMCNWERTDGRKRGVCFDKSRKKWLARLDYRAKNISLSKRFSTEEEAIKQRMIWEAEYFKEYAPRVSR